MADELLSLRAKALDPLFWPPSRSGVGSTWYTHVPFAHWLVSSVKPRVVVELGTQNGVSYAAFCEAVARLRMSTSCFAVDTWKGDEHSGFYGREVYEDLVRFNSARYAPFSVLLPMSFDEATLCFADGSIDLLHIDGLHTYEAVKHDFESWLPKLSERAVVLLHDTNVRDRGFGVWRLFLELKQRRPVFEFFHGYGLGVVAVGNGVPDAVAALCSLDEGSINSVRERFAMIGEYWAIKAGGDGSSLYRQSEIAEAVKTLAMALKEERTRADILAAQIDSLKAEHFGFAAEIESLRAEFLGMKRSE